MVISCIMKNLNSTIGNPSLSSGFSFPLVSFFFSLSEFSSLLNFHGIIRLSASLQLIGACVYDIYLVMQRHCCQSFVWSIVVFSQLSDGHQQYWRPDSVQARWINYLMWRSLYKPILRGQNLMHHIDGSVFSPSCDSSEFHLWYVTDQALLSSINATLSLSTLPYTIGMTSATEAWDKFARRFGKITSAHVLSLRKQMYNIKKGSLSMGDYLQCFKTIID